MQMIDNVGAELLNMLRCAAAGAAAGIFYDLLKTWRIRLHPRRRAVFAADVFYCLLTAFAMFIFLLAYVDGELRLVLLAAIAGGFVIYRLLLSRLVMCLFGALYTVISAVFSFIIRRIIAPVLNCAKKIFVFFVKPLKFLQECIKIILSSCKKKRIRRKIAGRKRRCMQEQNRIQKEKAGC